MLTVCRNRLLAEDYKGNQRVTELQVAEFRCTLEFTRNRPEHSSACGQSWQGIEQLGTVADPHQALF